MLRRIVGRGFSVVASPWFAIAKACDRQPALAQVSFRSGAADIGVSFRNDTDLRCVSSWV
jgi:hypothetical protein